MLHAFDMTPNAPVQVIIERLSDVPYAIDFVRRQSDEELWERLIDWALRQPDTTGECAPVTLYLDRLH